MRVVVTGIGVVSPFGVGRERFWQHVSRGCSGTRAISDFDASDFPCRVAAPVNGVTIDNQPVGSRSTPSHIVYDHAVSANDATNIVPPAQTNPRSRTLSIS